MIEITDKHVFFFKDWLSNFHLAPFEMICSDGCFRKFKTSEQAFMYHKALIFEDHKTAAQILKAETPMEAKKLGRQVKHYDEKQWNILRYQFMFSVNYHKYDCNPSLKKRFMNPDYKGKTFVEASPWDNIWGIAVDRIKVSLEFIDNENNWKGQNLLGKVLTSLYETFSQQEQKNGN